MESYRLIERSGWRKMEGLVAWWFFFLLPPLFFFSNSVAQREYCSRSISDCFAFIRERLYYIYIYTWSESSHSGSGGSSRNRPIPKQVAGPCCPGRQLRFLSASLDIDDVISSAPSKENLILAGKANAAALLNDVYEYLLLWTEVGAPIEPSPVVPPVLLCTYLSVYIPFTRPLPIISIPGAQLLLLFLSSPTPPIQLCLFLSLRKNGWKIDTYRSKERETTKRRKSCAFRGT